MELYIIRDNKSLLRLQLFIVLSNMITMGANALYLLNSLCPGSSSSAYVPFLLPQLRRDWRDLAL